MAEQQFLPFPPRFHGKAPFTAIYFLMGMYNSDDGVAESLLGFDCPFDSSPLIQANSEFELATKIQDAYSGNYSLVNEGDYPDIIVDATGKIQDNLYSAIVPGSRFNSKTIEYSHGMETLDQFWKREKWRRFPLEGGE